MTKTLSVSAIENGTVIDHIPAGQALRILHLLNIPAQKNRVTIGLNLSSKSLGLKDLIKIENRRLTETEANEITVFAPKATINLIENFEIIKKITTQLPPGISNVFDCLNPNCITQTEAVKTFFYLEEHHKHIKLTCKYCEKVFTHEQISTMRSAA